MSQCLVSLKLEQGFDLNILSSLGNAPPSSAGIALLNNKGKKDENILTSPVGDSISGCVSTGVHGKNEGIRTRCLKLTGHRLVLHGCLQSDQPKRISQLLLRMKLHVLLNSPWTVLTLPFPIILMQPL